MRFSKMPGAILPILFALFLIGCADGLSEAENRYNTVVEFQGEGRLEEAIEDYDEAIRLDPELALAYNNRGLANFNLGQHQKAIQDYGEAIRLDPQNVEALTRRALAYTLLGMDAEAQEDIERATELVLGNDR